MGKVIDALIKSHIDRQMNEYPQDLLGKVEDPLSVRHAAENSYREEVKKEIEEELTESEKKRILDEAQKRAETEAFKERVNNIRSMILQGIGIAFIVGLDVNQITNLYGFLKAGEMSKTLWAIGCLTGALALITLYWMFSEIFKLFNNRK